MGDLDALEVLWIKSDGLTGTIPAQLANLTTLYLSASLTGPVPAWIDDLENLQRLYLHNNDLTGPIPAQLADLDDLTTLWLAGNQLTGTIPPAIADMDALQTLDVRHNPLTWPPPQALQNPPAGLTALLPDTASWVPPTPAALTVEPGDETLTITWTDPGAGTDYLVENYTINYRAADQTGAFAQHSATESPVVITGLANATEYVVFVTAANIAGTSQPSLTVTATPAEAAESSHVGGYSDVDRNTSHAEGISALARWGILHGTDCGTDRFCPLEPIERWKLAVWLVRALDRRTAAPPDAGHTFDDVADHMWYEPYIERLKTLGVTTGCSQDRLNYCPTATVTRAQMASFLVRAFDIPAAPPPQGGGFTDVNDTSVHYENINALYASGITVGCSRQPVLRLSSTRRWCRELNQLWQALGAI